jgi:hypothetical protein
VKTPIEYICGTCGVGGVKLWRRYNAVMECQRLRCQVCSERYEEEGRDYTHQTVGWLVPAVMTPDRDTFWAFLSIPREDAEGWLALPDWRGIR